MPTYRYKCPKCGYEVVEQRPINDRDNEMKCPKCEGKMERQFSVPGVMYYTDGFYQTEEKGQRPKGF